MITLQKLHILMVVHDHGSFNKAAAALYMAQSAVSQHIQSLEAALGAQLFERSPRGVTPTPAGDVLYDYARRMFHLLAEAEQAVLQSAGGEDRQLAVAATPGVSVYLLPRWLRHFQQTEANISLTLQTELTRDVAAGVLDGRYDLGFLEGELLELDTAALGKTHLRTVDYFVTVNPAHALAGKRLITRTDLAGQPYINRLPTSRARRWLDAVLTAHNIRLNTIAELDSPGAIKYALLNNMDGIAILPDYVVEREAARGELVPLQVDDLPLVRPLLLVWDRRRAFSAVQRAFLSALAGQEPGLPLWALFQGGSTAETER